MEFSRPSLHPPVVETEAHKADVLAQLPAAAAERLALVPSGGAAQLSGTSFAIPLSTVSRNGNFDSYIGIAFAGQPAGSAATLLLDSGNSMLIVPRWEDIAAIPNWQRSYTIVGAAHEPWGCPANVVRGPILIPTAGGEPYRLENCVFYACTGGNSSGNRTANFGAGCVTPWGSNGWNTPGNSGGVVMQSPLSYNAAYPYAQFVYAPAADVFHPGGAVRVAASSSLVMYAARPAGYSMFAILPSVEWMSVSPLRLSIAGASTQWPGSASSPIAMVDTGGGPVLLSDPNGYVWNGPWPNATTCPTWVSGSQNCRCVSGNISLTLGEGSASITFTIDTSTLPPSVQGLTLVMCEVNQFMWGKQGMNIGGISALFQNILVDYANAQVGFRAA